MTTTPERTDSDVSVVYETTVTAIGEQVPAFLGAGILILFADSAPEELHPISVLHSATVTDEGPRPGDQIQIGASSVDVLAVGHVVGDNLLNLGHMDLKSDGRDEAKLPGDVCVPKDCLVQPAVGDVIRILRPTGGNTDHSSSPQGAS